MHWRRKWQPTPMFLPGESQGWEAWWAAIYGVAQSRIWLKRLSNSSSSQSYGFSSSHGWMWELDYKESWAPKNWCFWTVVLEKTLESPLDCKEIQPVHPKGDQSWIFMDWCWSWSSNTLATWCEELIYLKRSWCWERLKAGGEGDDRGWDGWMASPTQSLSLSKLQELVMKGKPGVLQSMGSQRVGHKWSIKPNWIHDSLFSRFLT